MSKDIIREGYIKGSVIPVSMEGTNIIMNQMKFGVCKIYKIGENGKGFFCNLPRRLVIQSRSSSCKTESS